MTGINYGRNTMTTTSYTAPQNEDEQSEEDREALDQYAGWDQPNPPKAVEHLAAPSTAETPEQQLAAVLALHKPVGTDADEEGTRRGLDACLHCSDQTGDTITYPCETARAAGARRDEHDPTLVPTMSGALVPEMNRTFAEAQALGDGSYQHDTHAIPDED